MPAESIHLSAFGDLASTPRLRRALAGVGPIARIGVMFVDLPYFDGFAWNLVRYLARRPQAGSRWGDRLHQQAPIALGMRLAEEGARLGRGSATRDAGHALIAFAVGYLCHAAVDTALHPLVNRLAAERGARFGTCEGTRLHQEVEKYQSVLFHEARHGVDYLGTRELGEFIAIDWRPLGDRGPFGNAIERACLTTLGEAPTRGQYAAWARGYRLFATTIASPLARRIVTADDKARERPRVIEACDFSGRYHAAVARSERWIDALLAYVDDGVFDASSASALACAIPEQSLDPPPESVEGLSAGAEDSPPA
jgi:hypothetical protein